MTLKERKVTESEKSAMQSILDFAFRLGVKVRTVELEGGLFVHFKDATVETRKDFELNFKI